MPMVAFITVDCIEVGLFLAMACDYRIQDSFSGVMCLLYVDRGISVPKSIVAMLRATMPSLLVYRNAVIEGRYWTREASLKAGLADGRGGMEECPQLIRARKPVEKSLKGAIAALREDQYRVS